MRDKVTDKEAQNVDQSSRPAPDFDEEELYDDVDDDLGNFIEYDNAEEEAEAQERRIAANQDRRKLRRNLGSQLGISEEYVFFFFHCFCKK